MIWCETCSTGYDYSETEREVVCWCGGRVLLRPPSMERDDRVVHVLSRDVLEAERAKVIAELKGAFARGDRVKTALHSRELRNILNAIGQRNDPLVGRHDLARAAAAADALREAADRGDVRAALEADADLWGIIDGDCDR